MAASSEESFSKNKVGDNDSLFAHEGVSSSFSPQPLGAHNVDNKRTVAHEVQHPDSTLHSTLGPPGPEARAVVLSDSVADSDSEMGSSDSDSDTLDSDPDSDSDSLEQDDSDTPLSYSVIAPTFAPLLAWLGIDATTNIEGNPSLRCFLDALHGLEDSVNQYKYLLQDYKGLRPAQGREEAPDREINEGCQSIDQQQAHVRDFFQKIAASKSEDERNRLFGDAALAVIKCNDLTKTVNSQLRVRNWVLCHADEIKGDSASSKKTGNTSKKIFNGGKNSNTLTVLGQQQMMSPNVIQENITPFLRWLGLDAARLLTGDVLQCVDFTHALSSLSVTVTQHFTAQQNYDNLTAKLNNKGVVVKTNSQYMGEQLALLKDRLTQIMEAPDPNTKLLKVKEAGDWIRQCDVKTKEMSHKLSGRVSQLKVCVGAPPPRSRDEIILRACSTVSLSWEEAVNELLISDRKLACFRSIGGVLAAAVVLQATLACDVRELLASCVPGTVPAHDSYLLSQQAAEVLLSVFPLIAVYQGVRIVLVNTHRLHINNNLNDLLSLENQVTVESGNSPRSASCANVQKVVDHIRLQTCLSGEKKVDLTGSSGVSLQQLNQFLQQSQLAPVSTDPSNGHNGHNPANHSSFDIGTNMSQPPQYFNMDNPQSQPSTNQPFSSQPSTASTSQSYTNQTCTTQSFSSQPSINQTHNKDCFPLNLANKRVCYSPNSMRDTSSSYTTEPNNGLVGQGSLVTNGGQSGLPSPTLLPNNMASNTSASVNLDFTICQVAYAVDLFKLFVNETIHVSAGDMAPVPVGPTAKFCLSKFLDHRDQDHFCHRYGTRNLVTSGYFVVQRDPPCMEPDGGSGGYGVPRGTLHTFTRALPYHIPSVTSHVGDLYEVLYSTVHTTGTRAVLLTTDAGPGWSPKSVHTFYNLGRLWRDLRLNVLVQTTYAPGFKDFNLIEKVWPDVRHVHLGPEESIEDPDTVTAQGLDTAIHTLTSVLSRGQPGVEVLTHAVPCVSQADLVYDDHQQVDGHLCASIKDLRDRAECKSVRAELEMFARHAVRRHHQIEFLLCTDASCEHCTSVPICAPLLVELLRRNHGHMPTPTPGQGVGGYAPVLQYMSAVDSGQTVTAIDSTLPSLQGTQPPTCQRGCGFIMFSPADRARHDVLFHLSQREAENRKISRELKRKAAQDGSPAVQVCKFRMADGQMCNETFSSYYQLKRHKDQASHKVPKTSTATTATAPTLDYYANTLTPL